MSGRSPRFHRPISVSLSLGLALAGWTGIARGQALAVVTPGPDEYHLTATIGVRPNSNVFFSAGAPQSDYITTFALALNMRRHTPRTEWALNYRPVLSHYLDFSELDSFSQAFNGAANYRLSERTRLQIREIFSLSRDPIIVATPQTGDSPILTNTQKRWRNLSGVNFSQGLSRSLSWTGGVQYYANRFDDPESTDNNGLVGNLSLNGILGREDTLTGLYTPAFVTFYPSEPTFNADPCAGAVADQLVSQTVSQTQRSTANQFGVGWDHSAAGVWATELYVGSSLVDQQIRDYTRTIICQPGQIESETNETDDRNRSQRLFIGRAALRRAFLRVDLEGGYQRRLTAETGANTVTVGDSLYTGLNARIGQHFTYGIGLDYSKWKSLGGATTAVDIESKGVALSGGYAINDWCSLTALANFREQKNSGEAEATQTVDNYFLGVSFRIF